MSSPFAGVETFEQKGQHHTVWTLPDGRLSYYFTGAIGTRLKGTGQDWTHDQATFSRDIPGLPPGKGLTIAFWAPLVTLASIANDNTATNAGWAVDDFSLNHSGQPVTSVQLVAELAVRDADGYVLRLAYSLHLIGSLGDLARIS